MLFFLFVFIFCKSRQYCAMREYDEPFCQMCPETSPDCLRGIPQASVAEMEPSASVALKELSVYFFFISSLSIVHANLLTMTLLLAY